MSQATPASDTVWLNGDLDELGNMVAYIKSLSKPGTWYAMVVDSRGFFMCDCMDFQCRHAKYRPMLKDSVICKHGDHHRETLRTHARDLFRGQRRAA